MADETTAESTERADEDTTTEQARPEVPAEVKRALNKANKEAESLRLRLKEFEDRDKTELQKLAEDHQTAEQRAAAAETALAKYKVAAAKGVPAELVDRLHGATEEELAEDADKLLSMLGARVTPDFDGGARTSSGAAPNMTDLIRQAAGRR